MVRSLHLGSAPLWLDEAVSHRFAGLGFRELLAALELDSGPPGYYLLLRAWVALGGDSEAALRGLSLVCGVALVPALYLTGRRFFDERVGWMAGLVGAVLPLGVRYGQEARGYAFLALAGLAAMAGLALWVEEGRLHWLWLQTAALLAALYAHNTAVFLLAAATAYAGIAAWRRREWLRPFAGMGLAVLGWLPWVPLLLRQMGHRAPVAWMEAVWSTNGVLGSLVASLLALAPGGQVPGYVGLAPGPWPGLAAGVAALLLALGVWTVLNRPETEAGASLGQKMGRLGGEAGLWLLLYLVTPLLAALAWSLAGSPIYLPGRLENLVLPAFCLLLAVGIASLRPPVLLYSALAAVVLLSALQLRGYFEAEQPPAERELAAMIATSAERGDAVVATSLTLAPIGYYLRGRAGELEISSFPAELAQHPGNEDAGAWLADRGRLSAEVDRLVKSWESSPGPRRVWLALVPNAVDAVLFDRLRASPALTAAHNRGTFHQRLLGQEVTLFELQFSRR